MHKWAIPLAWVIGVGIAIAPGAMATMSCGQCGVFHFGLGRTRSGSNEYYVNLSFYIIAFVLPWVVLMFPLLALVMQVTHNHTLFYCANITSRAGEYLMNFSKSFNQIRKCRVSAHQIFKILMIAKKNIKLNKTLL